jgi:hypothetical protein
MNELDDEFLILKLKYKFMEKIRLKVVKIIFFLD